MRLGIGGSLFGIRGGISTRGIGLGLGPLSAGTSWGGGRRSRRSSGDGIGFIALLGLALFAFWPYWLGTYVAVQLGADNPSMARTVAGWALEVPWLLVLVVAAVLAMRRKAQQAAQAAAYNAPRPVPGPGNKVAYHHGACTVNHRTYDAATRCRGR